MSVRTVTLVLAAMFASLTIVAPRRGFAQQTASLSDVRVFHVQQNVYMLVGPAGNSAVQIGADGVVVVDTMTSGLAGNLVAAIRSMSSKSILQIINKPTAVDITYGLKREGSDEMSDLIFNLGGGAFGVPSGCQRWYL